MPIQSYLKKRVITTVLSFSGLNMSHFRAVTHSNPQKHWKYWKHPEGKPVCRAHTI